MTQVAFSDGKVVMKDGAVGTGSECCCSCQCSLAADQNAQPSVTVVDGGCSCETGDHSGSYGFEASFGSGEIGSGESRLWIWSGYSGCESRHFGYTMHAELSVIVECQLPDKWIVRVGTYVFGGSIQSPYEGIDGTATTCNLSVNEDGHIVGSVEVEMYLLSFQRICTFTLTFG